MLKILALISIIALAAFAGGDATFDAAKRELNVSAIIMFFVFIAGTLGVTYWAAKKTKSASDFYTAGGGITGFQWFSNCWRLYVSCCFFRSIWTYLHERL